MMLAPGRKNIALLGAGLLLLFLGWFDTLKHMSVLVWTVDIFSHGVWVPVVSLWLIWRERDRLERVPLSFYWPGAIGLAVASGLWLLGGAAEVKILQHVAFIGAVQCLVLASLGPAVYRVLLFPLLFLFAFVPFGAGLVGPLQVLTAKSVVWALDLTGVAHQSDGVLIQLSSGLFEVAAACAGVKFLFSSLVTGILLCRLAFRSWQRRVLMLLASIAVPLVANAVRVYGTLLISEATDVSFAKDVDHIVYGWGFLSFVLIILITVAYKFSDLDDAPEDTEEKPDESPVTKPTHPFAPVAVTLGMLAILASAWWLPAAPKGAMSCAAAGLMLPQCADCDVRLLPVSAQAPWFEVPSSDRSTAWMYRLDADTVFGVSALVAPDRVGHRLAAPTALVSAPGWVRLQGQDTRVQTVGRAQFEESVSFHNGHKRLVWRAYYVDGRFYSSALQAKIGLARLRLRGEAAIGQMLVAAAEFPSTVETTRSILTKFFSSLPPAQFLFRQEPAGKETNLCVA